MKCPSTYTPNPVVVTVIVRFRAMLKVVCLAGVVLLSTACRTDKEAEQTSDHAGEAVTGDEVNVLAMPDTGLVLVDYMLDRQQDRISGSVLNNSSTSFVNVWVTFNAFDVRGQMVGTVRDSTSEVQPGGVWQFGIPLKPGGTISRVQPVNVQGTPRHILGGEDVEIGNQEDAGNPTTPQEETRTPIAPH